MVFNCSRLRGYNKKKLENVIALLINSTNYKRTGSVFFLFAPSVYPAVVICSFKLAGTKTSQQKKFGWQNGPKQSLGYQVLFVGNSFDNKALNIYELLTLEINDFYMA